MGFSTRGSHSGGTIKGPHQRGLTMGVSLVASPHGVSMQGLIKGVSTSGSHQRGLTMGSMVRLSKQKIF